ncbi:MAG TPA: ATP-dependent 6-phosphofructokinase [Smithellaceae bacterium]|nr:ATP-dependent 6-phosphofructokinase [Smithellaceae bacterium]HRS88369.1 ATP-dependent 6-phosphofructokinase [Smithellaceae bacterium]HRV25014.1 ATP-dependent 6-phosphofructokinase [Smithellaceae bacterium]
MKYDFTIENLGKGSIASPLSMAQFIDDGKRMLFNSHLDDYSLLTDTQGNPLSVEIAGPREKIFFQPERTKAIVVTCGGLCPGINDVIRSITLTLFHRYNVTKIWGARFGLRGLNPQCGHQLVKLTPDFVDNITSIGGSILSSSRGPQDINVIVDFLQREQTNILFLIGGDGTMRAAAAIKNKITEKNLQVAVIGVPKTIDNDLDLIQKSFGFDTAIEKAVESIKSAHVEAKGYFNGIGLIKIMGRLSGHIAAHAALAQNDVNFVLIPEVPFDLDGDKGFLKTLEKRMKIRGHAVILVAEGAGQDLMRKNDTPPDQDPSGNIRLLDIGFFMKNAIENHFRKLNMEINLKYIEPSYLIRSIPANASDGIYCSSLGQFAVHAAMAGKTGLLVALMREEYVHLPLDAAVTRRKIDPRGNIWQRVLETTGQPASMKN